MRKIFLLAAVASLNFSLAEAKDIKTVDDLVGQYINKTVSMYEDPVYEGSSVTVLAAKNDSVVIYNLFEYGTALKAKVNLSDLTLTIPSQLFYSSEDYGDCDFSNISLTATTLKPDRSTPVKGKIDPQTGVITLESWGVFINKGQYADYYYDVVDNTRILPANGLMHNSYFVGSDGKPQYDDDEANVRLRMNEQGDSLIVENFGDRGLDVSIKLNADGTVVVPRQVYIDADDSKYGDFYTQGADWAADTYTQTGIVGTWTPDGVTLGNWTGSCLGGYYMGKIDKTTIAFTDGTKLSTTDGIERPVMEKDSKVVSETYYSLDGRMSRTPLKGMNIIVRRHADGTQEKLKSVCK